MTIPAQHFYNPELIAQSLTRKYPQAFSACQAFARTAHTIPAARYQQLARIAQGLVIRLQHGEFVSVAGIRSELQSAIGGTLAAGDCDVDELAMLVLMMAADSASQELADMLGQMQTDIAQKAALRRLMELMNQEQQNLNQQLQQEFASFRLAVSWTLPPHRRIP